MEGDISQSVYGAQHHDFDAEFNFRVATFFCYFTSDDFDRSTISDLLRFALRAHGLRRLLRRPSYIFAPCGWEQGARWDHILWVGSGPSGIRKAKKGPVVFSRLL